MRDEHDRHGKLALQFLDLHLHLVAQILVEGTQRLIHQHNLRVKRDRARQGDTLLLAA